MTGRPRLIVFSGLPGTGKTTLARSLSLALGAVYLRLDSIEDAIRRSALAPTDLMDAGYRATWALATDNLALGLNVVGDCVNPVAATRLGWQNAAFQGKAALIEIEVTCSDPGIHRSRVEARHAGGEGPDWAAVLARRYEPHTRPRIVLDTAHDDAATCLETLAGHLGDLDG